MGITIRTNTPFASLMTSAIPGAKYVYAKPIAPYAYQRVAFQKTGGFSSPSSPSYTAVATKYTPPAAKPVVVSPVSPKVSPGVAAYNLATTGRASGVSDFKLVVDTLSDVIARGLKDFFAWGEGTGFDFTAGSTVSGGGGGSSDWLTSMLGLPSDAFGQSDDSFMADIQKLMSSLPQAQVQGEDTFSSEIMSLLASIPENKGEVGVKDGDTFISEMLASMPIEQVPQEDFMAEIQDLMASMPYVEAPSIPADSSFYDYYYYYKADNFLNGY